MVKETTWVMCWIAADTGSASEGSSTTKCSPKSQNSCLEPGGKKQQVMPHHRIMLPRKPVLAGSVGWSIFISIDNYATCLSLTQPSSPLPSEHICYAHHMTANIIVWPIALSIQNVLAWLGLRWPFKTTSFTKTCSSWKLNLLYWVCWCRDKHSCLHVLTFLEVSGYGNSRGKCLHCTIYHYTTAEKVPLCHIWSQIEL